MFSTPETSVHVQDKNREISPLLTPLICLSTRPGMYYITDTTATTLCYMLSQKRSNLLLKWTNKSVTFLHLCVSPSSINLVPA